MKYQCVLEKSIKKLKKLRKYVLNSLKYDYTNAMVEGKNNKIKVIKRVPTDIGVLRILRQG